MATYFWTLKVCTSIKTICQYTTRQTKLIGISVPYTYNHFPGNEFSALIEFAPFQKVPKRKTKKPDSRKGTMEKGNTRSNTRQTYF